MSNLLWFPIAYLVVGWLLVETSVWSARQVDPPLPVRAADVFTLWAFWPLIVIGEWHNRRRTR